MNVGSLFSGIGGIELGFEREGFKTAWFVEKDEFCQAVLKKHWPNTPVYGDITTIDFTKLEPVEILTGGFPCQDISNAGAKKGITGERSGLWKEYVRAIGEIRPKYAFVENVSALTYRGLLTVLADLATLGYDADGHCLPASALGAPHRRDRIYILAYANNSGYVHRQLEIEPAETRKQALRESLSSSPFLANTDSQRCIGGSETEHWETQDGTELARRNSENDLGHSNGERMEEQGIRKGHGAVESGENLANANGGIVSIGFENSAGKGQPQKAFGRGSYFVSDFDFEWKLQQERFIKEQRRWIKYFRQKNRQEYWATDAGILRVAHGIPNRVHRIKALGNAVVPQVAQFVARQIKERWF